MANIIFDNNTMIGETASKMQAIASNPTMNVWVNASAGTGKTKVLTERVLRLLLPIEGQNDGTDPENILCVTFTKAGANEMITRLMGILSKWAVCPDPDLVAHLEILLGYSPSIKQKDKARKLFAMVIDLPNGLNITTIHALCQSILGRFTIEAGLPPNFSVMEDGESQAALRNARDGLVKDILEEAQAHPLYDDFTWLARIKNSDQIHKILNAVLSDRKKLGEFFDNNPDYSHTLRIKLQLDEGETEASFKDSVMNNSLPEADMKHLAKAFEHGSPTNRNDAIKIYDILNGDRAYYYEAYKVLFLTGEGEIKKDSKAVSVGARKYDPNCVEIFLQEAERLYQAENRLNTLRMHSATVSVLNMAQEIIHRYQSLKIYQRKVDYDDLIHKTLELLSGNKKDWVLFKLDYSIDHILVDEAQDTSPDQWAILQALWSDFFSGETVKSEKGIERTVFVVGDNKQSIFSFQGANLETFNGVHDILMTHVKQAQKKWEDVPMNTSFRSTSAVLDFVDQVFDKEELRRSLTQIPDNYKSHLAHRQGHAGMVELWPLYKAPQADPLPAWSLPITIREAHDANQALANRIAAKISLWLTEKVILKSKGRPIAAGDIMILVRRRNSFVDYLIRALKTHNVPVSGADRLVIANHIAVQDILSALQFALLPDDDLILATLLKSPFIGWNDADIENYAYNRDCTLWNSIKNNDSTSAQNWLSELIASISGQNAFTAISNLLNHKAACGLKSGWQSLISRLGEDCIGPLEELLAMAQSYDASNAGAGLQGFVHFMQTNKADIKRELDNADNKVRIMTVHASKGLQAPIVFIPDTTSLPKPTNSDDGFIWTPEKMPLWSPSSQSDNFLLKQLKTASRDETLDEYYRLFYVALTRAEDRLIICGTLNNRDKNIPEGTWYQCAMTALGDLDHQVAEWPDDTEYQAFNAECPHLIFETQQTATQKPHIEERMMKTNQPLPIWVTQALGAEHHPPRILKPSIDETEMTSVRSPLLPIDDSYRFRRGLLTHSLLQYLPDVAVDNREIAGRNYLKKQAPDITQTIQDSILHESLSILNSTDFAAFFGEGSMAEVPVTGTIARSDGKFDIISGQIDRLLITDDTIWIVDFKSNRPPPRDPDDIPIQYRKQLWAYKTLIQDIYPDHIIRCALLWTDGPFMTELKNV